MAADVQVGRGLIGRGDARSWRVAERVALYQTPHGAQGGNR